MTTATDLEPYDVHAPGIPANVRRSRAIRNFFAAYPAMQVPSGERTLHDALERLALERPEWRKRVFLGAHDTWEQMTAYARFLGVELGDRVDSEFVHRLELHLHGLYQATWDERNSTEGGRAYIAQVRELMGGVL